MYIIDCIKYLFTASSGQTILSSTIIGIILLGFFKLIGFVNWGDD